MACWSGPDDYDHGQPVGYVCVLHGQCRDDMVHHDRRAELGDHQTMLATRLQTAAGAIVSASQQLYATAGTYTFVVPAGITSVSVCCIGGGGGATSGGATAASARGGGGGALAYVNSITVTPGGSYTVVVGAVVSSS